MSVHIPADGKELSDLLARAAANEEAVEIISGGSKRSLGRFVSTANQVELSRIAGIVDYDPAELLLTLRPGTALAEVDTLLDGRHQMLAFEPPDWSPLLDASGTTTIGGVVACNQAGPRRVKAGAARDHLLGFSAVNGVGQPWKAGGKVVKNVTGYDMCKLQCGAFGTLSVLTELTLKVMPRPETSNTLVFAGGDGESAIRAMGAAMNSPHEISAAAFLPDSAVRRSPIAHAVEPSACGSVLLRVEGFPPSVDHRVEALRSMFAGCTVLDDADSQAIWKEVGVVKPLLGTIDILWRVLPVPSAASCVLRLAAERFGPIETLVDWAGGQVWLGLAHAQAGHDAGAAQIRSIVSTAGGGSATLFAAPKEIRASADVFQPLSAPLAALTRRVKQNFDPHGILNPGRMYKEF